MIRVCPNCSRINIDRLKEKAGSENVKVGCTGICKKKPGKSFGYINNTLVITETDDEFISKAVESVKDTENTAL